MFQSFLVIKKSMKLITRIIIWKFKMYSLKIP